MESLCLFGHPFFKIKFAGILNFQWIKYLGRSLSYLKNWGIGVYYCWNYEPSKLLLHFTEYRIDQLNNKHTKIVVNSAIQYWRSLSKEMSAKSLEVFGPSTSTWRTCKIFAKLNGNHLWWTILSNFTNIRHLVYNMSKIWFANNKFNLLRWNKMHFSWFFKLPKVVPDLRLRL